MRTGIELIAVERQEQIEKHHRTIEDDVKFNNCYQLSIGAIDLININHSNDEVIPEAPFGWDDELWVKMCNKPLKKTADYCRFFNRSRN
jgi:hypothetical protein